MKKIKLLGARLLLAISLLSYCSANAATSNPVSAEKQARIDAAIEKANADGKITYSELKTIATEIKGKNLTLKDKLALRIFGNRMSKAFGNCEGGSKIQNDCDLPMSFPG